MHRRGVDRILPIPPSWPNYGTLPWAMLGWCRARRTLLPGCHIVGKSVVCSNGMV